jgi:DNA-binding ferritin-like protein
MNQQLDIAVQNMISQWGQTPYGELSVILVFLRYLLLVHHTNHHISKGDTFYSDHLLFERLYTEVEDEIDAMAEKAVGLGTTKNVNLHMVMTQLAQLVSEHSTYSVSVPRAEDLAHSSLYAEQRFLHAITVVYASLEAKNQLTKGVDNMLAGLVDDHESHIYLLKQRVTR